MAAALRAATTPVAAVGDYVEILKPRVMSLVVFTGFVGLYLAPGHLHPFLASVAAFVSVSSIVLDETAPASAAILISVSWAIGATMQIAAGIVARIKAESSEKL